MGQPLTTAEVLAQKLRTTEEVAERFRTSPETVRYWRHIGTGPRGVKVGRRVLYADGDLDAWLEEQREKQTA